MKTLIIVTLLLIANTAYANDWDRLRNDIQHIANHDIGPQSSMTERCDPPDGNINNQFDQDDDYRKTQDSLT